MTAREPVESALTPRAANSGSCPRRSMSPPGQVEHPKHEMKWTHHQLSSSSPPSSWSHRGLRRLLASNRIQMGKYGAVREWWTRAAPRTRGSLQVWLHLGKRKRSWNGGSISCTGLVYQSIYAYLQVVEGLTATYLPTQPRDRAVHRFCIFLPTDSTKMDCYVVPSSIAGGLASILPAGLKGVVCSVRRGEDGFQHDGFGSLRRGSRPVDHWPRLGQASDLISECLRLTNCRPDGVGRPALGK